MQKLGSSAYTADCVLVANRSMAPRGETPTDSDEEDVRDHPAAISRLVNSAAVFTVLS